jgi:hypothetical protein
MRGRASLTGEALFSAGALEMRISAVRRRRVVDRATGETAGAVQAMGASFTVWDPHSAFVLTVTRDARRRGTGDTRWNVRTADEGPIVWIVGDTGAENRGRRIGVFPRPWTWSGSVVIDEIPVALVRNAKLSDPSTGVVFASVELAEVRPWRTRSTAGLWTLLVDPSASRLSRVMAWGWLGAAFGMEYNSEHHSD